MILYNVTVKIDNACHDEWLKWMQSIHIPGVIATGCFKENKMMRLLDPPPDDGGITYAIQYFCDSMDILQKYWREDAPRLQAEHTERYKGRFVAFRTVMEVI